ncbi:lipocalin [Kineobactrum sediminis]|uniref:Outer membrane lipoprotein Blc n=1 Tax=Kineobactrum sediminis TaxID=1905677 RepID=A0A2N5Y609_9GAMM|nr:lipocalin family protein [Kineobactrum sediminis]PLW83830.1 lipocalin [Kineobactrum sediminis]
MSSLVTLRVAAIAAMLLLTGCLGKPAGVKPVKDFEVQRYLGTWYEIARLDHSFERGLSNVTAHYSLNNDGNIRVLNKGYDAEEGEWKEAEGLAKFVGDDSTGHLKVSFFGPFYSSYVVFELDHEGYQYAFVSGFNTNYLWLLARSPEVSDDLQAHFVESADRLGFDVDKLIFVEHDRQVQP